MRVECIRCDQCQKEHDAQYELPRDWIRTFQRNDYREDVERHFCSLACLIAWASELKSKE